MTAAHRCSFPTLLLALLLTSALPLHAQQLTVKGQSGKSLTLSRADLEAVP
jgi:hypothetical protein